MLLKNKFDIKMNGFQDPKSFFIVLFFFKATRENENRTITKKLTVVVIYTIYTMEKYGSFQISR